MYVKVEPIFKGSLVLIPSPSTKIQIMGGKFCLRYKCKTLLSIVNIIEQCFALLPQGNFSANNLNFHWRWWDWLQAIVLNLFYFNNNIATISNLRDLWVRHEFLCEIKINLIICKTMFSTNLIQKVIHFHFCPFFFSMGFGPDAPNLKMANLKIRAPR